MSGKYVLELTPQQKNVLTDALIEHVRCPWESDNPIIVSPEIETTMGELIRLVTDAKFIPDPADAPEQTTREE